jgi:hypothetical protein
LWLPVFKSKKTYFSENQISHVHLKPEKTETAVDGEEI